MDFQSHESKECGQRWVGDPNLGKERTRGTHKEDMTIKKKKQQPQLGPFAFLYKSKENFQKTAHIFLFADLLPSFFLSIN